ncbi:MAG: alkaline shock response membrane anchor protein AmaP [Dehalococcoidia bacterium]|nr:alkaline shock response membrane anchor protein AmaP [Dehalococcoidia bacterium]
MMISAFNRVVVILIALLVLSVAIVTIGVATMVWTPDVMLGWFQPQLQMAATADTGTKAALLSLSVIAAVGMLALLIAEVTPLQNNAIHVLSRTEKGTATIEDESLCLLAEKTGESVHGVTHVRCFIQDQQEGLLIKTRATVSLGSNLLEINPEMKSKIRESIQQLTGLPVARIDIKFKFHSDKRSRVSVR